MELGTYKFIKQPNQYKGKWLFKLKTFIKKVSKLIGSFGLLATIIAVTFTLGQISTPEHLTAETVTVTEHTKYPVMDRIAACESKQGQFNPKGEVVTNLNSNGSVDVGQYQINMSPEHIKESAKLGFNVMTESGNRDYAMYIYTHYGTGAWSSSAHCWNK